MEKIQFEHVSSTLNQTNQEGLSSQICEIWLNSGLSRGKEKTYSSSIFLAVEFMHLYNTVRHIASPAFKIQLNHTPSALVLSRS